MTKDFSGPGEFASSTAPGSDDATGRTLLLVRHAKAEAWAAAEGDRGRSLSARGRRDAASAGRWLLDSRLTPDAVACSPSNRTRETWDQIAAQLDSPPVALLDDRIYDAGVDELLAVVQETDPSARTLVVVGHAPGIPDLAAVLDRSDHPDLGAHFPTCAIAVLSITSGWADVGEGGAELRSLVTPRG